jgi:hypothetical protein
LTPLPGSWLGANAKPSLGTPQITKQPQGIPQLLEGRRADLTIEASVVPTQHNFADRAVAQEWHRHPAPAAHGHHPSATANSRDASTMVFYNRGSLRRGGTPRGPMGAGVRVRRGGLQRG